MGDRERRRVCGEVRVVSRCARYKRQGGKRGMEGERTWKVRDGNGGKDNEMCVCACVCARVRACVCERTCQCSATGILSGTRRQMAGSGACHQPTAQYLTAVRRGKGVQRGRESRNQRAAQRHVEECSSARISNEDLSRSSSSPVPW